MGGETSYSLGEAGIHPESTSLLIAQYHPYQQVTFIGLSAPPAPVSYAQILKGI